MSTPNQSQEEGAVRPPNPASRDADGPDRAGRVRAVDGGCPRAPCALPVLACPCPPLSAKASVVRPQVARSLSPACLTWSTASASSGPSPGQPLAHQVQGEPPLGPAAVKGVPMDSSRFSGTIRRATSRSCASGIPVFGPAGPYQCIPMRTVEPGAARSTNPARPSGIEWSGVVPPGSVQLNTAFEHRLAGAKGRLGGPGGGRSGEGEPRQGGNGEGTGEPCSSARARVPRQWCPARARHAGDATHMIKAFLRPARKAPRRRSGTRS